MSDIERRVLEYLLNSLWQVPLVFAAAWIAARIAQRSGPQTEHRVWVSALMLEAILPACNFRASGVLRQLWGFMFQGHGTSGGWVRVVQGGGTTSASGMLRMSQTVLAGIAALYGFCLVYFVARLAWGLWRTGVITRHAERVTLTGEAKLHWQRCASIFGCESAQIAVSPMIAGPMTVGGRQGVMLVPPGFLERSTETDLRAVVAHEFAHMRRRDFLKNLMYGILSLPVAYHPFLWMTRARLAEGREMVCDEMAAEAVEGKDNYVRSLLRLASLLVKGTPDKTLHAIGIFDANIFERRVMNLTQKHVEIKGVRRLAMAAACVAVGVATCASALALRMDVDGPPAVVAKDASGHVMKVEAAIMAGQIVQRKNPVYPAEARKNKDTLEGPVVLHVIIGKDGAVKDIQVKKSLRADYDLSALEAVKDWVYKPYLLNGEPVEVDTTITVNYSTQK
jgi:TonB family protein